MKSSTATSALLKERSGSFAVYCQSHLSFRLQNINKILICDDFRGSLYIKKLYRLLYIILLKSHRKCVKLSNSAASTLLLNTTILFEELKFSSWTVKTQRRKSVWENQFKQATETFQRDFHFSYAEISSLKTNEDVSHYTYSHKSDALFLILMHRSNTSKWDLHCSFPLSGRGLLASKGQFSCSVWRYWDWSWTLSVMKHKPPLKPDIIKVFCFQDDVFIIFSEGPSSFLPQHNSVEQIWLLSPFHTLTAFNDSWSERFCRCSIHQCIGQWRLISCESLTLESSPCTAEKTVSTAETDLLEVRSSLCSLKG